MRAALTSPWDFIAICFRNCGFLFSFSFSTILKSKETIAPMLKDFISTNLDFALTGESLDCQTSLQVIIIGNLDVLIRRTSSGTPPMSEPVTPSTSSMRIIFDSLNRLACFVAGANVSSSFFLFLKSEEFNSTIS